MSDQNKISSRHQKQIDRKTWKSQLRENKEDIPTYFSLHLATLYSYRYAVLYISIIIEADILKKSLWQEFRRRRAANAPEIEAKAGMALFILI